MEKDDRLPSDKQARASHVGSWATAPSSGIIWLRAAALILPAGAAAVLLLGLEEAVIAFLEHYSLWILAVLAPLIVLGGVAFAMRYLQGGRRFLDHEITSVLSGSHRLEARLRELEHFVKQSTEQALDDETRAERVASIRAGLVKKATEEFVSEIKQQQQENTTREDFKTHLQWIKDRLAYEVDSQARRGNLNLIIGMVLSVLGFVILGVMVFYLMDPKAGDLLSAQFYSFVPRLSVVILMEIFAFFFLRLYRQSLGEIKYFQNELTNVEFRLAAGAVCLAGNNDELVKNFLLELARTERNFVLEKGQSTVQLEHLKMDRENLGDLAKLAGKAIDKLPDGK